MILYDTKKTFCVIIFVCLLLFCGGCSSSVRYTRNNNSVNNDMNDLSYSNDDETQTTESSEEPISSRKRRNAESVPVSALTSAINSWLGVPYRYGGMSKKGTDCSGFVTLIYRQVYNIDIPRSSKEQARNGKRVFSLRSARPGDLVFFRTSRFKGINHVGIYIGDNRFAHASLKNGVVYSNLTDKYYSRHFVGTRRYL